MTKSRWILSLKRVTPEEKRESIRRQLAQVLPVPRVGRDGERQLDEELISSAQARHPHLTREQVIKYLLAMGA